MCSLIKSISLSIFSFTLLTSLLGIWRIQRAVKGQDVGSTHILEAAFNFGTTEAIFLQLQEYKKATVSLGSSEVKQHKLWDTNCRIWGNSPYRAALTFDASWRPGVPRATSLQTSWLNIWGDVPQSPLNLIFSRITHRTQKSAILTVTVLL